MRRCSCSRSCRRCGSARWIRASTNGTRKPTRRRELSAALPGRRERKKIAARAAILDASAALFVDRGFERTRIETIAERADVGVGTVYNHFETKADILVAILFADAGSVVERTRAIVERGEPDAATVVREAVGVMLDVMAARPRGLWRDLIGHALLDGGKLGAAYFRVEAILRDVVHGGLVRLRENRNAPSTIPLDDATGMTFALAKAAVYAFVFENADSEPVLARLHRQLSSLFPAAARRRRRPDGD